MESVAPIRATVERAVAAAHFVAPLLRGDGLRRVHGVIEYYRMNDLLRVDVAKDLLQVGGANQQGGAGLGIDAIYSLLSKEGKNARYLQKIIERDYREMIINYRYTASLVKNVTGLEGESLADFMQQYRPSYFFVLEASDYALIDFIKSSYKEYQKDPAARRLPPLTAPQEE